MRQAIFLANLEKFILIVLNKATKMIFGAYIVVEKDGRRAREEKSRR